jgi:hypothetical protein
VKAERNLRAKSLKVFREKFSPDLSIRTSLAEFERQDWLLNVPLYAIGHVARYWLQGDGENRA